MNWNIELDRIQIVILHLYCCKLFISLTNRLNLFDFALQEMLYWNLWISYLFIENSIDLFFRYFSYFLVYTSSFGFRNFYRAYFALWNFLKSVLVAHFFKVMNYFISINYCFRFNCNLSYNYLFNSIFFLKNHYK